MYLALSMIFSLAILWEWMLKKHLRCGYCGGVLEHHAHCPHKTLDQE